MEIPTKYDPLTTEDRWYAVWMQNKQFKSTPDKRESYTIVIPPPNVTGVLHMGHMLNNTIQDVLIRRARMQGKNTCWVPGTDHASIATEAKVVTKLKGMGINKADLTREEFLKHAWEWKEKHGGIILEQLKKLGASCDWDRTSFTMDPKLSESVVTVFVDLYKKGSIYRGVRMVNWDPQAKTAVSDEEVIYREVNSKLYYVNYHVVGEHGKFVTIATTRPETILGDTAVCVNPDDPRYAHLEGKKVIVPLVNREVPIIRDAYVDMEFGTGCLKITPAHDINDYEIGNRFNLQVIDIFNDNGTLNENAGVFVGEDRFKARDLIVEKLKQDGFLVKAEDYTNKVGYSERTDAVIEPKLSMQWFLKMKEISKPALDSVMNDEVKLHPAKFKNVYRHWMENVKDWCISRQLWWGQRIPAWYLPASNEFVVAANENEALKLAQEKTGNAQLKLSDLRQDEDVVDTWFSSWLWPITVFDGINNPDNPDFKYYYPTCDLVSGHDILFFWIARMIIAGYEFQGKKPFSNVYLTGMVRDKQGRKMSKQLGNSPDPVELMKLYGADGVRVGMLLCSPAGGDLLFDECLTEQGRNFSNKIWNAFRLVKGWQSDEKASQPESAKVAIVWFESKLNHAIIELEDGYDKFRISETLMIVYKLFWDDFSSSYLEAVKPAYQHPIDAKTLAATVAYFEKLLQLLHPFTPFITEEIWHYLIDKSEAESIINTSMPRAGKVNAVLIEEFEFVKEVIAAIRTIRAEKNIPMKEAMDLLYRNSKKSYDSYFNPLVMKLANLSTIIQVSDSVSGAITFIVNTVEFSVPISGAINIEEEILKINEELRYAQGFLMSVMKKLSNESFVSNAPPTVIEKEQQKKADAESKIKTLEAQLIALKG